MYILDTNIIVDHIRRKRVINIEFLKAGAAVSIITLAELLYGAEKSDNPTSSHELIDKTFSLLKLDIVNLNEQIVREFGNLKAYLEIKGQRLEDFDLLIGATAKVNGLTLVTRNLKHFKRIKDLKLASS